MQSADLVGFALSVLYSPAYNLKLADYRLTTLTSIQKAQKIRDRQYAKCHTTKSFKYVNGITMTKRSTMQRENLEK